MNGIGSAIAYLKEIDAMSKAQKQVANIAQKLKNAVDKSLADNPIFVTSEGVMMRAMDDMKQFGGAAKEIISDSKTLLKSVCKGLITNLEEKMPFFQQLLDKNKLVGFGTFTGKYATIDFKHILGLELDFSRRGLPKIGGFHHDFLNAIEQTGLLEFTDKVFGPNGIYRSRLVYNGQQVKKSATFFPSSWSREQVITNICEAYNDHIRNGIEAVLNRENKYIIQGITKEGMKIEMCITAKGKIRTAYPLF